MRDAISNSERPIPENKTVQQRPGTLTAAAANVPLGLLHIQQGTTSNGSQSRSKYRQSWRSNCHASIDHSRASCSLGRRRCHTGNGGWASGTTSPSGGCGDESSCRRNHKSGGSRRRRGIVDAHRVLSKQELTRAVHRPPSNEKLTWIAVLWVARATRSTAIRSSMRLKKRRSMAESLREQKCRPGKKKRIRGNECQAEEGASFGRLRKVDRTRDINRPTDPIRPIVRKPEHRALEGGRCNVAAARRDPIECGPAIEDDR